MEGRNPLTQKVNFIVSVVFLGSVALLAIVTILEASEESNPLVDAISAHKEEIREAEDFGFE